MYNFTAIVGELCSFLTSYCTKQPSVLYLARICSKDAIDLLPYLKFFGAESDSTKCCSQITVATGYLFDERAWYCTKETLSRDLVPDSLMPKRNIPVPVTTGT